MPGHRLAVITALIRSLPKAARRNLTPVNDVALRFLADAGPEDGPLHDVLARALTAMSGDRVRPSDFEPDRLPPYLRVTYRVEDDRGRRVASGHDLAAIHARLAPYVRGAVARAAGPTLERTGLTEWDFGQLPQIVERNEGGLAVRAFPALIDEGATAGIRLFASAAEQERAMWEGTRRLLVLAVPSPTDSLQRVLPNATKLALATSPEPTVIDLLDECVLAVLDELLAANGGPARDASGFEALSRAVRGDIAARSSDVARSVAAILRRRQTIGERLDSITAPSLLPARLDVRRQLARLIYRGFVPATGTHRLDDLDRYLRAVEHRLERLAKDPGRDAAWMATIHALEARYAELAGSSDPAIDGAQLGRARWLLEELRVGLFAQTVGTPERISEERVRRALDAIAP